MKVKELLKKAKDEIKDENEEAIVALVKNSLRAINSTKKTLRKLENSHQELLDEDSEDLELEKYQY